MGGDLSPPIFLCMNTLGQLKTYYATSTVNRSLTSSTSLMGQIVHWVWADLISHADFWWNQGNTTFATVASTAEYFLSNRVSGDKIWGMYDSTNSRKLIKKDLIDFYDLDPTPTDTGTVKYWAYVGQAECQAVPTAAGVLTIVSSSASDTAVNATIKGLSSGIERYEVLSLNGTTTVTGTISWDASVPLSISLSSQPVGLITAARSVTIAQIPPKHQRIQRPHIRLSSIPSETSTIQYFFYKRAQPLVDDSEIVDLPDEAFTAFRYGLDECLYRLVGKINAADSAYVKRVDEIEKLISWSDRDIAGNKIKLYNPISPFGFRLPNTIDGEVTG